MPRPQKKYHYIYRTTCLVTGKFYVGMHSADSMDDGYLGSGKILNYSRKKHGDQNHKKEIIEMCPSREALKLREKEIINEALLADPLNMNLKYGGEGGGRFWNTQHHAKASRNGGKMHAAKHRDVLVERIRRGASLGGKNSVGKITHLAQTPEARAKRIQTLASIGFQQGQRNSQFGTKWMTNGTSTLKVRHDQVKALLEQGFRLGRK